MTRYLQVCSVKHRSAPNALVLLALFASLVPIVLTYVALGLYARDIPMFDDYLALLRFAVHFHAAPSLLSRLALVVSAQHSEYKLIFENVIVAVELAFTGRLNLLFLVWLGNLSLLGLLWPFWKGLFPNTADRQTRAVLMVPVCWLLFQLNYVEALDWAMGGLQSITVIVFTVWSLFLLKRSDPRLFALSCLAALLAVCSSANGLLLAPVGLLLLARGRHLGRILWWVATFAFGIALYLFRYTALQHPTLRVTVPQRVMAFLSFLGGAVENRQHHPVPYASVVLGLLLLGVGLFALSRRYDRENAFAAGLWLWIVLSAFPVIAFRTDATLTAQLTGRYKIYSDLLLILTFAFAIRHIVVLADLRKHARPLSACLVACVLFSLSSDVVGVRFLQRRLRETGTAFRQRNILPSWNAALREAEAEGVYTPPR